MGRKARLDAEMKNEPIKKIGREEKRKLIERQKRKSRRAKLGAYVEDALGKDTTPENFFEKAKSWIERQKMVQRARMRAARLNEDGFYSPPEYQFKNPLAKYAFDNGAMY